MNKENINEKTKSIKKNQIEIRELNNTITKLKNSLDWFNHRFDQPQENISKLNNWSFEIIESNEQRSTFKMAEE